ncbi:protein of unknown function (plasmid) [Cupriavidus taiwanensis]|uniref:Uncharacterized protein n=2 Tax=Cupriavidus TaxID=106589 RepID=A0A375HY28_9BURK|nr:hypothetical protein CBM2597_P100005 [Cupriavidus taiwanensis]SPD62286.1 protein of unknown function [Cupriavidus neocaledonicus]SPC25472.1 hypothetical protein CBM2594_P70007 [Cupriavidus taiwanensis]SPD37308.1 protein of unknown function [Cupriavidus taiwanensis]SPD61577.1 protein of unknown function [Cupriavidus taiwanensis]
MAYPALRQKVRLPHHAFYDQVNDRKAEKTTCVTLGGPTPKWTGTCRERQRVGRRQNSRTLTWATSA